MVIARPFPLFRLALGALILGGLLPSCGGRTLDLTDAGPVDQAPQASETGNIDDAQPPVPDQAVPHPDACQRPENGCFSSADCADGLVCEGCGGDPCCPTCTVCYGTCVPRPGGCAHNGDCSPTDFCFFEDGCGADGTLGACQARPQGCPENYDPVCGCDGQQYGNACEAASSGTSIAFGGPCTQEYCADLQDAYIQYIQQGKKCCPECLTYKVQCTTLVQDQLGCGCSTYINDNTGILNILEMLEQKWLSLNCADHILCPDVACQVPVGSTCSGSGATGICQDLQAP